MNFKKGLALFLCLAILLSSGAGAAFASVKISAKLISMDGDVQVIRAGGEKPFKAFVNMRLTEGDRIITGSNGTAKVQMEDDVIITLAENTRIYLSELRGSQGAQQSSINLQSGAVGSSVGKKLTDNSRFEIKTPTAVMGVRGTEFFTQYYNGNVDVRVVNGTVEVSVSVTSTGNIAGPGATAVQTYTFPITSLQQINFGEETPLSQLQQQPPQPLGLIGMPQPFLNRIQEISQQSPGVIPQEIINTIDQAVESARISIQNRMDNPNIVPSELESFIAGRIEGNLFPGLPNFGLPPMLIMPPPPPPPPPPLPPSFFPGGGGPTVDFGGDDGGTTPIFADFYMHREMEVEIVEETQLVTYFDVTLTFNRPVNANSLIDNGFMVSNINSSVTSGVYIGTIGENPNQVLLSRLTLIGEPEELEDALFEVTAPSAIRDTQNNYINGNRISIHGIDPAGSISITSITPNSQLVPGEVTDFTVTVAYSFANIDQAELGIGFNSGDEIDIFNMIDNATHQVTETPGSYSFQVSATPKDWGEDGDFKVYVNISETDHESGWTPLDTDEMSLEIENSVQPLNLYITVLDQNETIIDNLDVGVYYQNAFQLTNLGGSFEGKNENNKYEITQIPFPEDGPGNGEYKLRMVESLTYEGIREILITPDIYSLENYNIMMNDYIWAPLVGDIYGTISQFASGETLNIEGVKVLLYTDLENMDYPEGKDITNDDGSYYLSYIPSGPIKIVFEKEGYLKGVIESEISWNPLVEINSSLIPKEYADNLVINIEDYEGDFFIISADANRESDLEKEHNSIGITSPEGVLYQDFWFGLIGCSFPSEEIVEVLLINSEGETIDSEGMVILGDKLVLRYLDTGLTRTYTITEAPVTP